MRTAQRTRLPWVVAASMFVFPAPAADAAAPIEYGQVLPLQQLGLLGLEGTLRQGDVYLQSPGLTSVFIADQMMAVLVALEAARHRPDQASLWNQRARDLWDAVEPGFYETQGFYAKTVPPPQPSVCIDLSTNGWALRAALALKRTLLPTDPRIDQRIVQVRDLLTDLLAKGTFKDVPDCDRGAGTEVNVFNHPIALWALLEARRVSPSVASDTAIRNDIQKLLRDSYQGAFVIAGLLNNVLNARMLIVLIQAEREFNDTSMRQARDQVAGFLQNSTIQDAAGHFVALDMQRVENETRRVGSGSVSNQMWTAYALYNHPDASRIRAELVPGLLSTYVQRYWSPKFHAFASEASFPYFEANALPALLTSAPILSSVITDPPTVAFLVPSHAHFTYPLPSDLCGTRRCSNLYYVANSWVSRFTLSAVPGGPTAVLLPVPDLGAFNLSAVTAVGDPVPRLLKAEGSPVPNLAVPLAFAGNHGDLLQFTSTLSPAPAVFRFEAWAPVVPVRIEFRESLRIFVRSLADEPLTLRSLQFDVEATGIQTEDVTLNERALGGVQVVDAIVTEFLDRPHLRITLNEITLLPGDDAQIEVTYTDHRPPTVGTPSLSSDEQGTNPLGNSTPVPALRGAPLYVRAPVHDNAVLRTVILRYQFGAATGDVAMTPLAGQPDVYVAPLPRIDEVGRGIVKVVAVDAAGNLHQSSDIHVSITNPLFSGSPVLFVFSATLFLSTLIIWFKVRRRDHGP